MIVVHHLNNSRSQRVLWLLEELGAEYEIVRYQRDSKTMLAPPELRRIHPLGKSPVITEGPLTIAESGAIIEYLVDHHDTQHALAPLPGTSDRLRYTYWLHYAEGSAMPPLLMALVFARLRKAPMPFFIKPVARMIADKTMQGFISPQLKLHLDWMEAELGKSEWFAGERFTAADIQMSFPIQAAASRNGSLEKYPRLRAFVARIAERPAYQRAEARGGPLDLGAAGR